MNRFRITPSMAVALTALVFATTGAGYAATKLEGYGNGAKAAKSKKGKRGPAGPQGPQGPKGDPGANGTNGSPGAITFTGRMNTLNSSMGSDGFGVPSGASTTAVGALNTVDTISPPVPLTMKSLSIELTAAPGTTSLRFFHLLIDGDDSGACVVVSANTTCSIPLDEPIPPNAEIALHSRVLTANAAPADARFAWTAE